MQRQVCFQLLTWSVSQTSVNTTDKQLPLKGQYWHDLEWFAKNQGRYSSTKLQNFFDVYMVEEGGNIVPLKETVTLNGHWQTSQVHQFCKALYSAILVNHYSWNGRFPNMKKKSSGQCTRHLYASLYHAYMFSRRKLQQQKNASLMFF